MEGRIPSLLPGLVMQFALKMALCFLIAPILVMAQDPPPSGRPDGYGQSLAVTEEVAPLSNTTTDPSHLAIRIPVPAESPALLSLRPPRQSSVAAGYASAFSLSAGYSVTALGIPSAGRATLTGMNVGISVDSASRFAAKLDLGYAIAPNALNTGHRLDVFSYLVGPVLRLSNSNRLSTYAHLFVGGARVAGPFQSANSGLITGYVHYPAWAGGGGAEYHFSNTLGFRVSVDYLHTHFFNPSGAVRGQNGLRVVNSIVYYPGTPSIRRRR
jgi:hypothetical protein